MNLALRWVDGRLAAADDPAATARDRSPAPGRACYTTARIARGRPRWPERHAQRLQRDARQLAVGEVPQDRVVEALSELGQAAFSAADGIVRLEACDVSGEVHLFGVPRALGPEPFAWSARIFEASHPGPMPWGGAKVSGAPFFLAAHHAARTAGVDELLLVDRGGFLVEGSRSNLLWVDDEGRLAALPLTRGAVAGLALGLALERVPSIGERELRASELFGVRELIAVNAVRGARAVVRVDGKPIGDGSPARWARRLARVLED